MRKTKIIYWTTTSLVSVFLGLGSLFDAVSTPEAVAYVTRLGYPEYLVPFVGVAKLLGIAALWIPGFPRVKEWAYAGLVFDLLGAMYSHIAAGDPPQIWMLILIPLGLVFTSYVFYHKLRTTAETEPVGKFSLTGH